MMNGTLVHEEAEHLAARIRKDAGEERSLRFRMLLRSSWDARLRPASCAKFSTFEGSLASICRVLLNSNEFLYLE